MKPFVVFTIIVAYFCLLMVISYLTSRKTDNETYFTGDRKSPWFLVAFGMIGAGLSGVTFVSVPGMVANNNLYFFQFVLGNVLGYLFITFVLIPLYYKLRLVSIYGYLKNRFGTVSYKTGSLIFLISQSFGAALRLLLAAKILQFVFFDSIGVPFILTVVVILILVWLYTNKSGIKTIVWTDTIQTAFLIMGAVFTIVAIMQSFNFTVGGAIHAVKEHEYFKIFEWNGNSPNNFFKQFISGFFIAIAMMGLDQNMMQKTLTCKNRWDAQKNTLTYSLILAGTQFLFLGLGILLYLYAENNGVYLPQDKNGTFLDTDMLFPNLTMNYLGTLAGVSFLLGIIAASFSSVDSALTALTTSFTYDFLEIDKKIGTNVRSVKNKVLIAFSTILFLIIMVFSGSKGDVISLVFTMAGYTYGPLLGLFMFGMFTKIQLKDKWVPIICVLAPISTYFIGIFLKESYGFDMGFFTIAVIGALTLIGLILIRK
ncbi:sodium:solute symporter [Maribacter polysaccharolyticus]|uniref:sodium:solute symporter n=1 Tax=Maribacter polysaccharolyticus TaxID=3020831 RepID=UPI00237F46C5|nr:sodium:solute symporter [Maribacter polysaccharolyticus]MDE3741032.1 sodium:solute symporter [Maribacter polysaccharolyticus]